MFNWLKTHRSCLFISVFSYSTFSFSFFLCSFILLVLFLQISSARYENDPTKSLSEEADFLFECGISKVTWLFSEREQLKQLLCKCNVIYCAKASLTQFAESLQCFERGVLSCTSPINCRLFQKFDKHQFYGAQEQCQQQSSQGRESHNLVMGGGWYILLTPSPWTAPYGLPNGPP